jgi:hypothetical protein
MFHRPLAPLLVSAFLAAACRSAPIAPSAEAQAVVESIARQHADCVRLTVHALRPSGSDYCAIASTKAEKLGKPSDPEDLQAMKTGETIVLDEPGALDVTVPILQEGGRWTAACGVTLRMHGGDERTQLVAEATGIAREVEASLAKEPAR